LYVIFNESKLQNIIFYWRGLRFNIFKIIVLWEAKEMDVIPHLLRNLFVYWTFVNQQTQNHVLV